MDKIIEKYGWAILASIIVIGSLSYLYITKERYPCYQENAGFKSSSDSKCELIYEGIYSGENTGWINFTNTNDGDWSTFGKSINTVNNPTGIVTYIKPKSATGAEWKTKDSYNTNNFIIPQDCWDYNSTNLKLRYLSTDGGGGTRDVQWFCYNGVWKTLEDAPAGTKPNSAIYEEAIIWTNE